MVTAAAAYVKAIEESGWLADTRYTLRFKIYIIKRRCITATYNFIPDEKEIQQNVY